MGGPGQNICITKVRILNESSILMTSYRLNGEMACKIRDVLSEIDDRGLPKWISLQMNLFPQLKELSLNMT